ncbi:MAG: permease [Gemmatimonadota bacterium]|nr:permease [Gemmatimonadota bacterium]MDQ8167560.1 permease [Gemmatimonadota bacterium]MDQ8173099.1 permease [Gemmatimonadota bacterium]
MSHALLLASMAGLGSGPLVARSATSRPQMLAFIDGFVLITIGGLVLLDVVPPALTHRDWWAGLFMLAGFSVPTLAERLFRFGVQQTHTAVLLLALVGVAIHSALDGSALAQSATNASSLIGYGVVLHQLPVSLMVWWVLSDRPRPVTWFVLTLMAVTTVVGYFAEPTIFAVLPDRAGVWFEAVVGGSLLHVIAHPAHAHDHEHAHDHGHDHAHDHTHGHTHAAPAGDGHEHIRLDAHTRRPNGIGALVGGVLLVLLHVSRSGHGDDALLTVWSTFRGLALESAPALLVAYLMAGLVHAFVAPARLAWLNRGSALRQALSGMALGLPLPICSCGVVPLYEGLVKQGISTAAAVAFLIATPELGIDAVLMSVPLLGLPYTVVRVAAAALVALAVALVMARFAARRAPVRTLPIVESPPASATGPRWRTVLRSGFGDMVDHTAPWILVGLIVAALIGPLMEGSWMTRLPMGVDVLLFAAIGLPLYVCASASTPLVAVLVAAGVSPGAGLALLITGPATNMATIGILARLHGARFAYAFAAAMIVAAITAGLMVNVVLPAEALPTLSPTALEATTAVEAGAALVLVVLCAASVLRRGARGFLGELRMSHG